MTRTTVNLRTEVRRGDLALLCSWISDGEVAKYLHEDKTVCPDLQTYLHRTDIPDYTPLFNRDGRFFMIGSDDGSPIGFVRLVFRPDKEVEIVLAIGDRSLWGKGIGTGVISDCLRYIFFTCRAKVAFAVIHPYNARSMQAFAHNGFRESLVKSRQPRFELTQEQYFHALCS